MKMAFTKKKFDICQQPQGGSDGGFVTKQIKCKFK